MKLSNPMTVSRMALCLLTAPTTISCVSTVCRYEYYAPELVEPTSDVHVFLDIFSSTPGASMRSGGETTVVRCEHRIDGFYAWGLMLPFVPLFGLFGDDNGRPVVITVRHSPRLEVDIPRVQGTLEGKAQSVLVTATGSRKSFQHNGKEVVLGEDGHAVVESVTDYLALSTTFEDEDSFTLDLPMIGPGDKRTTWVIRFTREGRTEWDDWLESPPARFPLDDLRPLLPVPAAE